MKPFVVLSVAAIASSAAVPNLVSRQLGNFLSLFGVGGAVQAPILNQELKPQHDPAAKRELKVWGPFKLQPANSTHGKPNGLKLDPSSDVVSAALSGICNGCMVLEAQGQMSFANGSRQDIQFGVYTHHILFADIGRPAVSLPLGAVCPDGIKNAGGFAGQGAALAGSGPPPGVTASGPPGQSEGHSHGRKRQAPPGSKIPPISILVGNGEDASPLVFASKDPSVKSGFYIGEEDKFGLMAEVINYDNHDKDVWFSVDIEYIEGPREPDYLDVGGGALNIDGCSRGLAFHPPADKAVSYTSNDFIVGADGYLLNFTPHLHDGGINIEVFRNKTLVCHSDAVYGDGEGTTAIGGEAWETITAYTPCEKAVKVSKGDILSMSAEYDLTKHRLRPDSNNHEMGAEAMALATYVYAREPVAPAPAPAVEE
ncbi:hypothetical protein P152DRAFT_478086 [Eremomyces bilateralis CBS 781.70]|uniref:Uncharacterized protein n=1 Tax=Eremomyces bilateralis CBS 781.70 TaxID=1392243 RepID=A0A6G1GG57_9PEZI|nr:uncharacterized protein P152DRAFT_478086 [Eremomyces bilateralis CBS 781.70]KAF1817033.1 hypothetical protein P152DRAFT_478086 [Eremomyces bilateralis CBS 781.70]